MKRLASTLGTFAAILLAAAALGGTARADLSEPVILVASPSLDGSPFEQTVLLATPLANGGHIGFILNKPTGVKLDALFPDDTAAHDVEDGAYLGGPVMLSVMFALTRNAPERPDAAIPLMPGLFAVVDKDAVDHIIRTTPNDARYFLGVMVWRPGQLANQVDGELWDVRPANADIVLRARSSGLWNSLRGPWVNLDLDLLPALHTAAG